jgi:hypothetical protein
LEGNELYEVNAALFDCIDRIRDRLAESITELCGGSSRKTAALIQNFLLRLQ